MKVFSAQQLKAWDVYTMQHTPISSLDLMERAAQAFTHRLLAIAPAKTYGIVCGAGNNGGDGLAVARLLKEKGLEVRVLLFQSQALSEDATVNYDFALQRAIPVRIITSAAMLSDVEWQAFAQQHEVLVDALWGTGLNRSLQGEGAALVTKINQLNKRVVSIDLPSGLSADTEVREDDVVMNAEATITFQVPKQTFFYPSSKPYLGTWYAEPIGLLASFVSSTDTQVYYTTWKTIQALYKPRAAFAHKGDFGRGLLMAGSYGMMGAAVLSARACLRSGIGLLKVYTPRCGYEILQTSLPEAMVLCDEDEEEFSALPDLDSYSAMAIGPGWKESDMALQLLSQLLKTVKCPLVIDASALNLISRDANLLSHIATGSILTPHHKEFERLAGKKVSRQESERLALEWAQSYGVVMVLKGKNTAVVLPDGTIHYNATGNAGMAKGGSGDCLTGILLSLLAQGYSPAEAAIMGVFMHGYAGDRAASYHTQEAMLPSDLIECLGEFFEKVKAS
jgi:ADP-dependent NAD(P)H-hydrate dehydratase / NAD(P)H-hydrate epimerase